jgi:hypothetical protein
MSEHRIRWGEPFATAAIVVLLAAVPASCGAQVRDMPRPSVQAADIPPFPPDTTPGDDVWRNTDPSGTMARDLMWVAFKTGTSIEEKRQAVTAVSGHVIGGRHLYIGEGGMYLVRIPDPGDDYLEVIGKTRSRLRAFPFVQFTMVHAMSIPLWRAADAGTARAAYGST